MVILSICLLTLYLGDFFVFFFFLFFFFFLTILVDNKTISIWNVNILAGLTVPLAIVWFSVNTCIWKLFWNSIRSEQEWNAICYVYRCALQQNVIRKKKCVQCYTLHFRVLCIVHKLKMLQNYSISFIEQEHSVEHMPPTHWHTLFCPHTLFQVIMTPCIVKTFSKVFIVFCSGTPFWWRYAHDKSALKIKLKGDTCTVA